MLHDKFLAKQAMELLVNERMSWERMLQEKRLTLAAHVKHACLCNNEHCFDLTNHTLTHATSVGAIGISMTTFDCFCITALLRTARQTFEDKRKN